MEDLQEGSHVLISATGERGIVEWVGLALATVRTSTKTSTHLLHDLRYLGTPGHDAPYLSDYDF